MTDLGTEHQDPVVAALEKEFARHGLDLEGCGMVDERDRFIASYARSLTHREREIAEVQAFAKMMTERLQGQIESIKNWRGRDVARVLTEKTAHVKGKSVNTPYGRVGFRKKKPTISWDKSDEPALLKWCQENCPDAVNVIVSEPRHTIVKTPLIELHMQHPDTLIPGTDFVDERDELYVQTRKDVDDG